MTPLTSPDAPHIRVKQCRHGLFMYNTNDTYIGRSLDVYGEFSEQESRLFQQILRPGMVAFDIGANIGAHTVTLTKAVGTQGQVVAFEPQRIIYQMLCGNIALNGLTNVMALMAALSSKVGSITVPSINYGTEGNFGGVSLSKELAADVKTEIVPLLTLDSFKFPRCDFIKIDVEGMELDTLQGATELIGRCKPILYLENDREEKSLPLIEFLFKQGYRLYWHTPYLFNAENYSNNIENIFPNLLSVNVLCIPRELRTEMKSFVEITPENADQYIRALA